MPEIILVQQNSNRRIKFIILTLEEDTVSRVWGLIDGKAQTTSNIYSYINKGKANELNPSEAAAADFYRIIDTKLKEGYIKTESLDDLPKFTNEHMDFSGLPVQFCCSKPHTSISTTKCNKLIKQQLARFFVKENGLCHFILITDTGEVKIYTRRIDDHTRKYPTIVKTIQELNLPKKTLLITEFIVDPELMIPHMQGFSLISSISRSDTLKGKVREDITQTLALQEKCRVVAVVFNILFVDGNNLTEIEYGEILELLSEIDLRSTSNDGSHSNIILPKEMKFKSYEKAYSWAYNNKKQYEGLVVWNVHENADITYNGKPNRRACYKLKAVTEDDVVAYDWKEGTGAKQGKVGSLLIGKYDKDGIIVPMGNVGSGLKIKQGECEVSYWEFPCVIEIEYDQRFPTGSYQFPRFSKRHEDKIPLDVVIDKDGF